MVCFITFICIWLIIWFAFGIYLAWSEHQHISFANIIAMGFISLGIAMTITVIIAFLVGGSYLFYYFLCSQFMVITF